MHRRLFLTQTISIQHVCESESVIVYVWMLVSTEPNNLYYVGNNKNSLWVSSIPDGDVKKRKVERYIGIWNGIERKREGERYRK